MEYDALCLCLSDEEIKDQIKVVFVFLLNSK